MITSADDADKKAPPSTESDIFALAELFLILEKWQWEQDQKEDSEVTTTLSAREPSQG
jgi:hypothetical protein